MKRRKSRKTLRNSSRRQRHNIPDLVDPNLVDSISPLPDSILGIILSFLPTKNAVATAILSKRWKSVWMTVHNLDFCHELEDDEYEDIKFIRFVNRVMLLHDAGLLYKFRLVWNSLFISPLATSWINTAITRNVHELFLSVWDSDEQPFEMPISVFSCGSLRSLELCGVIIVSAANVVFLPRLESLKLVNVEFQTKEEFEKVICGCPMLTCIHLHVDPEEPPYNVGNFEGFMYIISSISLRRLELQFGYECSLKLEASSLEYFKLHGYISEIYVQKSLSSLVEADFSINLDGHDFSYNSIVEAIRAFDYAKALTLSCDAMEALNSATISLSTDFKRLMKLETESYACDCIPLQDFIQSSHNLEVFTNSQQSYDEDLDHSMWTIPAEVPRCLSNSLKKVVFDGYNGLYNEREMIRYILNHGSVLEVMKISCARGIVDGAKLELVQEICNFPKKSPACEVEFL